MNQHIPFSSYLTNSICYGSRRTGQEIWSQNWREDSKDKTNSRGLWSMEVRQRSWKIALPKRTLQRILASVDCPTKNNQIKISKHLNHTFSVPAHSYLVPISNLP